MTENQRLEALRLAVQHHQAEQGAVFASSVTATATTFLEFLQGTEEEYTYWRMEDFGDIYYRSPKNGRGTLERWVPSYGTRTTSGRWTSDYDRSNPQSVRDIQTRREYLEVGPQNVPAALRA